MADFSTTDNSKAPKHSTPEAAQGIRIAAGPFIGEVKHNIDTKRSGRLTVYIEGLGGNSDDTSCWRTVQYASPFYGVTPPPMTADGKLDKRQSGDNFETNPHSYGFWMVPPDIGAKVLCTFVQGDPGKGYWFACLPDWPNMHMVPGLSGNDANPLPLTEFNPGDVGRAELEGFDARPSRPVHQILANQLVKQGLDQDRERGLITSSAFRESPSAVFGFSTPGRSLDDATLQPAESNVSTDTTGDKTQEQQDQQKAQQQAGSKRNTGRGRRGGHSFVMDDGDADGKNQLVRLRSANGNMIMMNDTSGFIYIINATGTAWMELDSSGAVNIYSETDIKFAAKNNIYLEAANGGIKMHAKNAIDIVADATLNATGKGALNIYSDKLTKVTGKDGLHLKGKNTYLSGDQCVQINGGQHLDLGASCINLNCSKPTPAQAASSGTPPQGMPTKEPWTGHKKGPGGSGSGTSKNLGAGYGQGNGVAGNYGKSADYSGVGSNSRGSVTNGTIGSTGGAGPGSTGFRQGTEAAPTNTFGGNNGVGEYRGYPNLNGSPAVGTGQCVALVQAYSNAGPTSGWRPADNRNLFDNPPQPGAAIATLDRGYYANQPTGNHAAIYLGQGSDSRGRYILVQEQNVARDQYGNKVVGERRIYERTGGSDSNNASTFRVIANKNNPEGVSVRNAPPVTQKPADGLNPEGKITAPEQKGDRPDVNKEGKGFVDPAKEQEVRESTKTGGEGLPSDGDALTESDGSKTPDKNAGSTAQDTQALQDSIKEEQKIQDKAYKESMQADWDLESGKITRDEYNQITNDNNKIITDSNTRIAETEDKLKQDSSSSSTSVATGEQQKDVPNTSYERDFDYIEKVQDSNSGSNNPTGLETTGSNNNLNGGLGGEQPGGNLTPAPEPFLPTQLGSSDTVPPYGPDISGPDYPEAGSPGNNARPPTGGAVGMNEPDTPENSSKPFSGDKQGPGQGGVQGPTGAPQNTSPQAAGGPSC
jgi:hypothetical protein